MRKRLLGNQTMWVLGKKKNSWGLIEQIWLKQVKPFKKNSFKLDIKNYGTITKTWKKIHLITKNQHFNMLWLSHFHSLSTKIWLWMQGPRSIVWFKLTNNKENIPLWRVKEIVHWILKEEEKKLQLTFLSLVNLMKAGKTKIPHPITGRIIALK